MSAAVAYVRSLVETSIDAIDDPEEAVAAAVEIFAVILVQSSAEKRRAIGITLVDRAISRIKEGADGR